MLVPNAASADTLDQAEPDAGDYLVLGEHNTGVLSGGVVTASSPESLVLNVSAARVLINAAPFSFNAGTVTLGGGNGSFSRFDLVGWTSAGLTTIAGTASANPVFPTFDPATFCLAAAVSVGVGASTLGLPKIVEKRVRPIVSLRRSFTDETTIVTELSSPAQASGYIQRSNGTMEWVSSILRRTAAAAMEWATALTLKQTVSTAVPLMLKAAAGAGAAHKLLDVQANGSSTSLASINALGQIAADNFKWGSGAPTGTGKRGDLYINRSSTDFNSMLYIKTVEGGTTGWVSFRSYSASESALPTGTVVAWAGTTSDAIPDGFSLCNGAPINIDSNTTALAALIGSRFGSAPGGQVRMPNTQNRVIGGASAIEIEGLGTLTVGNVLGINVRNISVGQMPAHAHEISDPGHVHPQQGPYWYYKPGVYGGTNRVLASSSTALPGIWEEGGGFDRSAQTNIQILGRGGDGNFTVMQETIGMNYLIKW